jgi:hypothetical protein
MPAYRIMKRVYDFSNAERGRFYRPDSDLAPPVHLDQGIRDRLATYAKTKGETLNELVNELLRKDIERIEAAK